MSSKASTVVTLRVSSALARSLEREARRRRRTKSAVVREILADFLEGRGTPADAAEEARRQSLLVSRRRSERESLEFLERAFEGRGWR